MWRVIFLMLLLCGVQVLSQENRCICSLSHDTQLFTYDNEKMFLPLPCTYRLTSLKTKNGACQLTVDLSMTSQEGRKNQPAGMRYLVTSFDGTSGGLVDSRGINKITPDLRSSVPVLLSQLSTVDGVDVLAYKDESQSYKLGLMPCMVTLNFKPGKYLGVISHNFSESYSFNPGDLCGDCDGTRNEMKKLPLELRENIHSFRDRDAAMLYMTSQHISGGPRKCYEFSQMLKTCPTHAALEALKVCGRLVQRNDPLGKCVLGRTFMGQILGAFSNCVNMYCTGRPNLGCRFMRDLASGMFCRIPLGVIC